MSVVGPKSHRVPVPVACRIGAIVWRFAGEREVRGERGARVTRPTRRAWRRFKTLKMAPVLRTTAPVYLCANGKTYPHLAVLPIRSLFAPSSKVCKHIMKSNCMGIGRHFSQLFSIKQLDLFPKYSVSVAYLTRKNLRVFRKYKVLNLNGFQVKVRGKICRNSVTKKERNLPGRAPGIGRGLERE